MMPRYQIDRGAIKHILGGSDIMCRGELALRAWGRRLTLNHSFLPLPCPGLTSPGGRMDDVPADTPVAIMAEGKEHAMGIGLTKMSTKDM